MTMLLNLLENKELMERTPFFNLGYKPEYSSLYFIIVLTIDRYYKYNCLHFINYFCSYLSLDYIFFKYEFQIEINNNITKFY